MGRFVAGRVLKSLGRAGVAARDVTVGILGVTFKEDVPDLRNSRVPDIRAELMDFGAKVKVHDPLASAEDARHEWGFDLDDLESFRDLDALIVAVSHREYVALGAQWLASRLRPGGVFYDVKSKFNPADLVGVEYLSL